MIIKFTKPRKLLETFDLLDQIVSIVPFPLIKKSQELIEVN